jgi:hypothetical protein
MVNTDLVDSINYYMEHGYTKQQVIDYLISFGYPPRDVNEAYDYISQIPAQPQQPAPETPPPAQHLEQSVHPIHSHKKFIILVVALVFIIAGSFGALAFWQFTKPVCVNGIVENGETMETCCFDVGCIGEQACANNVCTDPTCGECQYLENHACKSYGCCENDECAEDEVCDGHTCKAIECGFCEYGFNHECMDYECCSASDCDAGMDCIENKCIMGCGECQYRADSGCIDYECCNNTDCAPNQDCAGNACVNLSCSSGEIILEHECMAARDCYSDADCDDNDTQTEDICIGTGTTEAHCMNIEKGECSKDSECDDDNITTEDICAGSPKTCSIVNCAAIGDDCPPELGACDGDMHEVADTEYCCVGICIEKPDLYVDEINVYGFAIEVEVEGINTVNASSTFKLFAFENGTIMNTTTHELYYIIRGQNETESYYFNFSMRNVTINVTAIVDFDDEIDEQNETNNNMTIQASLPEE